VKDLVQALNAGTLIRNDEYQRGLAWSKVQKAGFVDSLFRGYPVPALFLHEVESVGLDSVPAKRWEVVDGQQRLNALREFRDGKLQLYPVGETSKLRLPRSVMQRPAPWAGRIFADLDSAMREEFDAKELTIFMLGSDSDADEVRDLFIRLQSGTALSRQQIRDAWPGNLGPFIERLAGKMTRGPAMRLFSLVDKRGQKSEEEDLLDPHVSDRQVCAQLFRVFSARASDPHAYPSVGANELDSIYHVHTEFDPDSTLAGDFRDALEKTADVFIRARELHGKKAKFRRLDVTATTMTFQDLARNPLLRVERKYFDAFAKRLIKSLDHPERPKGKSTGSSTLKEYYDWFRLEVAPKAIELDPRRGFSEAQQRTIRESSGGACAVCGEPVDSVDAEYDHFPIPHRDGGKTEPSNGRLVHRHCHPRGRPREDA
jgi:hypothetical protein